MIGPEYPCFIIGEVSCNHAGSFRRAAGLVKAVARAGGNAVKFQLYGPDDMTLRLRTPPYRLTSGPWKGYQLWDLYKKAQTPREWFPDLFALARDRGIVPFASVFNPRDVDFTESLGMEVYKIASAEVSWLELVRAVGQTGKPVILSDGMANPRQLAAAMDILGDKAILLRCVSEYPAKPESYRLQNLTFLRSMGVRYGISDHTTGTHTAVAAVALGAQVVEKHIMADWYWPWNRALDRGHSVTPKVFARMVREIRDTEAALALRPHIGSVGSPGNGWRRRLVFALNLPRGTEIDPEPHFVDELVSYCDVRVVRCSEGWEPDLRERLRGKRLAHDVRVGDPVTAKAFA